MQSFSRRSVLHFGLRSGLLLASCGDFALNAHAQNPKGRKGQSNQRRGPAQPAPAPVPFHAADVILGRPTDTSVTLNLLRYDKDAEAILACGPAHT